MNLVVWQVQIWTNNSASVGFNYETTYTLGAGGHVANIFAGGPASNTTWARNTPTSLSGSNYNIQTPAGSTFTFGPGLNPIAVIPPGGDS